MNHSKTQCSWQGPIDYDGLNLEDKEIIQQVGLDAWLDKLESTSRTPEKEKAVNIEALKKKFSLTKQTKAQIIAFEFLKLASQNRGNVVTYLEAAKIHPAYPSDCAFYARQIGASVATDRKNKRFKVISYPK
jgi:hypothetical protein